jgi:hypothetical protein
MPLVQGEQSIEQAARRINTQQHLDVGRDHPTQGFQEQGSQLFGKQASARQLPELIERLVLDT